MHINFSITAFLLPCPTPGENSRSPDSPPNPLAKKNRAFPRPGCGRTAVLQSFLEERRFSRRGLLENRRSLITVVRRQVYLTLSMRIISSARLFRALANSVVTCPRNMSHVHISGNWQRMVCCEWNIPKKKESGRTGADRKAPELWRLRGFFCGRVIERGQARSGQGGEGGGVSNTDRRP